MSKLGISRPTAVVEIVTNLELLAAHQVESQKLEELNEKTPAGDRLNNPYTPQIREQAQKVRDIEQEMQDSTVCVKVRALKKAKYAEIVADHPAREGNNVDALFGVNTDTFIDGVMPLSIVEAWNKSTGEKVDFTGDDWAEESEEFTDAQVSEFVSAILSINKRSIEVPFSPRASAMTRN